MIGISARVDTQVSDDLIVFLDDFNQLAADIGEWAFQRIEDGLLHDLEVYPPPLPRSSYNRTFTLGGGWEVSYQRITGGFLVSVRNDVPYAKFVVGSLAQARAAAASFQAWMHKGRWPLASETVAHWLEVFQEEFRALFQQELAAFGSVSTSRRARTR